MQKKKRNYNKHLGLQTAGTAFVLEITFLQHQNECCLLVSLRWTCPNIYFNILYGGRFNLFKLHYHLYLHIIQHMNKTIQPAPEKSKASANVLFTWCVSIYCISIPTANFISIETIQYKNTSELWTLTLSHVNFYFWLGYCLIFG